MPKYAVTVDDNGTKKRVVLEADSPPSGDQVLAALRAQAPPSTPTGPGIGELRRREGAGEIAANPSSAPFNSSLGFPVLGDAAGIGFPPMSAAGTPERVAEARGYLEGVAQTARIGVPVAAALAFPPAAPTMGAVLASAGAIGTAGAAGEMLAQGVEGAAGTRTELDPGKIASAGILSATPMVPAAGLSGPFKAAAWNGLKQAAINQSTFITGSIVERALNEGRLPTEKELTDAVFEIGNYLPALIGGVGGGAQGFFSRGPKQLTEAQQIAEEGRAAGGRLEQATGAPAPLTAAEQTGINMAGNFPAGSGELAAQDALAKNVRSALSQPKTTAPSLTAEAELVAGRDVAAGRLGSRVAGTASAAETEVESTLGTILPGTARSPSVNEAANTTIKAVKDTNKKLEDAVEAAYNDFRNEANRIISSNPKGAEAYRLPMTNTSAAIDDIINSMVKEEKIISTPSPTGGPPTVTTERVPAAFLNEAISKAKAIQAAAKSPQNLDEVIQVRQTIDKLIHDFTEIAPGTNQRQLGQLRAAVKADELALAGALGGNAKNLLVKAQAVASDRFNQLKDNPIILRILKDPSERGAFQNSEQLYDTLLRQPESLDSLRKLLGPNEFSQLRRGLFDSIRNPNPVVINGQSFENAGHLSKGFRALPEQVRQEIAGGAAEASSLQSILDDASIVQNAGVDIPVSTGISEATVQNIVNNAGRIKNAPLRQMVMADAKAAAENARRYFNSTTKAVGERTLNPDIADDQFVRDFVLRSQNPQVVRDALGQLNPATRDEVRKQAAQVLMDHAIESAGSATKLENLINDKNRLQIAREILDPKDLDLINDFLSWNRARNLTKQGGRLEPNELANMVWNVTKVRFLVDHLTGNRPVQDFMAKVARMPAKLARLKPTVSQAEATRFGTAAGVGALTEANREELKPYKELSDKARASLPEDARAAFDATLGIP